MDTNAIHHVGPGFIWLVIALLFTTTSLFALGILWAFDLWTWKSQKLIYYKCLKGSRYRDPFFVYRKAP